MKYVTKLGAYGLAVAAAFAVALAVLVSVSSTVDAQTAPDHTISTTETSVNNVAPGDTVRLEVAGAFAQVSITGTADGVGGSFDANDGQSIACGDGATCDKDTDANAVAVDLTVDADSGEGHILLSVGGLGTASQTKVINVNKTTLVGSLKITASPKTISANGGTSTLTIEVKNASANPQGRNGEEVSLITTLGSIECAAGTETQACSVTTADATVDGATVPGRASVTLNGKGVEGQAVVTARLGSFTATATVTLFGNAKNLTATPDQGSVEIGGSVYVVLTVTDGAGNPVSGQMVAPVSTKEVVGPNDDAVKVETETDTAADGDNRLGRGYSKDKPAAGKAAAIPACGDDNTHIGEASTTFEELFGPDSAGTVGNVDRTDAGNIGEGTNDKGQCVVYVTAPENTTDATKSATRGVHTLNFAIGSIKASTEIEVAGKPHSISTDAPDPIEPGSVTKITVSVFDDEDVLVGITSVKVRKVGGDGLIEDAGDGGEEMTSNGQSSFTFIAPSSAGTAEILITAGTVNERVTLNIGEAMPDEPEEPMPSGDATLSGKSGFVIFSGGSLDDLEAAALDHCPGGAAIWLNDGAGGYVLFPAGSPIPAAQAPARNAHPDGFASAEPVNITACEGDAMGDDG